jgi:hypothetical protein
MSEQKFEEAVEDNFALPEWNDAMRESIEKVGGKKETMLPKTTFGRFGCRTVKIRRTRVGSKNPGLVVEAIVLRSDNEEYREGDDIAFFLRAKDANTFVQAKLDKLMAEMGVALASQLPADPNRNPFAFLDSVTKLGRIDDDASAGLTFEWHAVKGRAINKFDAKTGEKIEGHYRDDHVTPYRP